MARAAPFVAFRSFGGGTITFDWKPDADVMADRVMNVADALSNTRVPMAFAAQELTADIRMNFEGQHDPEGRPWEEWSENYAPYAEVTNIGAILQQSMELQDAATDPSAVRVTDDALFYDLDALPERGIWHQEGRQRSKGGDLPARPFLGLSDEAAGSIFLTFSKWFDRSIDLYTTKTGRIGRRHRIGGAMATFRGVT